MNSGNKKYTIYPVNVEFLFSDSSTLKTFTQGYVAENYTNIKNDFEKTSIYLMIAEKVLSFSDHIDNHELFFNFVTTILEKLNNTLYPKEVLALFEIKLLYLIGIAPIINNCTCCNNTIDEGLFSVKQSGMVCKKCSSKYETNLNIDESELFKYLYLIKLEKVDEEFLKLVNESGVDFNQVIDKYYEMFIDFKSKTKKILKKVS